LLEGNDVPHPAVEALFTIDEETGMTGAMGLEGGVLQGEILLNLDTEEDDEIDIGCAGGIDITATRSYSQEPVKAEAVAYSIKVKGLQGGHSGTDIHRGLGNANKIMNRLLYEAMSRYGLRISDIDGGGLRNAIPRESVATGVISTEHKAAFETGMDEWAGIIKGELAVTEPDLSITFGVTGKPSQVMERQAQQAVLKSIYAAHNGVYAMSTSIPGLVETSNNIARVEVRKGYIHMGCLTRSSVDSAKMDLAHALKSVFELAGCEVSFGGTYPGWKPNPDSEILKLVTAKYEDLFREKPNVVACHAGLECGIVGQIYPEMDMISFGPTIRGAHSPDERASITSVQKFWTFLKAILQEIPKR
jgi:dipeptidase D